MRDVLTMYIDFKSPYAYIAMAPAAELAQQFAISIDYKPYTLNIPDFLGSAQVDAEGRVIEAARNEHQWRRVRYSYMDARRYANRQGLTVRGPRKIFDSSIAHIAMLWVKQTAPSSLMPYMMTTFARFWRRELDIENPQTVAGVVTEAGGDASGFEAYLAGPGRQELEALQNNAEAAGVFGVPSFIYHEELFWGREHLELISERLRDHGLAHT